MRGLRTLLEPPWAGQKVGRFMRGLAWVVALLDLLALSAAGLATAREGIPGEHALFVCALLAAMVYCLFLFGSVALKGRAPSGWLPWR